MNTASLCIPQCTQRNMYISRATNARLPLPPHFSPRFSSCHHFRDHIVWTPAYCHSPPPLYSSISSIRSSPSREASGVTWIALMVPAIGELTTVSIFMAERTHSGWPFSTCKKCKHSSIKKCQMYRSMNKTSWFKFGCLCLMKLWNLDSTTAMSEVFLFSAHKTLLTMSQVQRALLPSTLFSNVPFSRFEHICPVCYLFPLSCYLFTEKNFAAEAKETIFEKRICIDSTGSDQVSKC